MISGPGNASPACRDRHVDTAFAVFEIPHRLLRMFLDLGFCDSARLTVRFFI
jgi:hypothetical protein